MLDAVLDFTYGDARELRAKHFMLKVRYYREAGRPCCISRTLWPVWDTSIRTSSSLSVECCPI
jgi:hypothetical protein